jgi:protein arginine N-methyltransferase 1
MSDANRRAFSFGGAYTLHEFGAMFAAPVRGRAYAEALARVIRPDSVVVELGAGPALFSLLACKLGAARVYAIEPNPVIELAPLLAADNGLADRLVCIEAISTAVTLPERADVLIADLRGVLPFFHGSVGSVVDARERFLKPGGLVVPQRDTLWAAVAHAPRAHAFVVRPWTDSARGLDLHRGLEMAVNAWVGVSDEDDTILSDPAQWGTIDYTTVRDGTLSGRVCCAVATPGLAHGMLAWFDSVLVDGVGFSNAPGAPHTIYGRAFFPWPAAHALDEGDVVETTFHVMPGPEDSIWTWETRISDRNGTERVSYRQSTFLGTVFPAGERRGRAHTHVPVLSLNARIDRDIMALVDGKRTLREIAEHIHDRYPESFANWNAALERVADVAQANEQHGAGAP